MSARDGDVVTTAEERVRTFVCDRILALEAENAELRAELKARALPSSLVMHGDEETSSDDGTAIATHAMELCLCDAAESGDVPAMERALAAGAEISWSNPECWHWTALHEACANGHPEAADFLIRHGAALEAVGKRSQTALHLASDAGEDDVVEVLIRHGANVHALDVHGEAPIDLADNALIKAMLVRVVPSKP